MINSWEEIRWQYGTTFITFRIYPVAQNDVRRIPEFFFIAIIAVNYVHRNLQFK